MSFKCDMCGKAQPNGFGPHKVVRETRRKSYAERCKADKVIDRGGKGFETVYEVDACGTCFETVKVK